MALVPYDPFRQLSNFRREIDSLFHDLPFSFHHEQHFGSMRVDVHETEREIIATCDLPGLESKEDVSIQIDNQYLTISGVMKRSNEVKEEHMHRQERFVGRFQRSVLLPGPVAHEGITATYRNGVLEIRMPKLASDHKRNIDVQFH